MIEYNFEYFVKRVEMNYGDTIQDDKYYSDEELMDNFYAFYVYAYSYLNLPAPSRPQLEMARFISDRSNPHRLVAAMRGLA